MNARLAKEEGRLGTGDPLFPKSLWPPAELCPACHGPGADEVRPQPPFHHHHHHHTAGIRCRGAVSMGGLSDGSNVDMGRIAAFMSARLGMVVCDRG